MPYSTNICYIHCIVISIALGTCPKLFFRLALMSAALFSFVISFGEDFHECTNTMSAQTMGRITHKDGLPVDLKLLPKLAFVSKHSLVDPAVRLAQELHRRACDIVDAVE